MKKGTIDSPDDNTLACAGTAPMAPMLGRSYYPGIYLKNSRCDGRSGALTGKYFEEDVYNSVV